jgi:hypothetical protein
MRLKGWKERCGKLASRREEYKCSRRMKEDNEKNKTAEEKIR